MKQYLISIAFLLFFSSIYAQGYKKPVKHYKNAIGVDALSVNYGHNFLQKERWALGVEATAGIGWRQTILLFDDAYSDNPFQAAFEMFSIIELLKVNPYFRYYYYKNNFFDAGLTLSYMHGNFMAMETDQEIPRKNYSFGFNFNTFYGWKEVKIGTGIQPVLIHMQHDNGNKKNSFALLWTPLIIKFLF